MTAFCPIIVIMGPSPAHEHAGELCASGSFPPPSSSVPRHTAWAPPTQRDPALERGIEPDSSFSLSGSEQPDRAVEIEVSRSSLKL